MLMNSNASKCSMQVFQIYFIINIYWIIVTLAIASILPMIKISTFLWHFEMMVLGDCKKNKINLLKSNNPFITIKHMHVYESIISKRGNTCMKFSPHKI